MDTSPQPEKIKPSENLPPPPQSSGGNINIPPFPILIIAVILVVGILLALILTNGALRGGMYTEFSTPGSDATPTPAPSPFIEIPPSPFIEAQPLALRGWQVGRSLPKVLYNAMTEVYTATDGATHVYEMGGYDPTANAVSDSVYYAEVLQDGSLGEWKTALSLPLGLRAGASVFYTVGQTHYLYVIGGEFDDENRFYSQSVYRTEILSDGSLSGWQAVSTLPVPLYVARSVVSGGYIFVIGGWSGKPSAAVYSAKILADGSLSSWQETTPLPVTLASSGDVAIDTPTGSYIYIVGGNTNIYNNSQNMPTVYAAKVLPDGRLGQWFGTAFYPVGISEQTITAYQKDNQWYLVGMGGFINGSWGSAIYTTKVHDDGSLDPWIVSRKFLPKPIASMTSFICHSQAGTFIYSLGGGANSPFNGGISDVYYTDIDSLLSIPSISVFPSSAVSPLENGYGAN